MSDVGATAIDPPMAVDLRARIAAYDWDGAFVAGCAQVAALVEDEGYALNRRFWDVFLNAPDVQHIRHLFTEAVIDKRVHRSTRFLMAKFTRPLDPEWYEIALRHAAENSEAGISIATLLAAQSAGYSGMIATVTRKLRDDPDRLGLLVDIIQRFAVMEAEAITSWLFHTEAQTAHRNRLSNATAFRETIAGTVGEAAELGGRIRGQAEVDRHEDEGQP